MSLSNNMMDANIKSGLFQKPITRREAIRFSLLGFSGIMLSAHFPSMKKSGMKQSKAKSVIQIWMGGGLSHLDTFDPKPEAGYDYCGPLNKPIPTNINGIRISELLPLLAKQADKYSIIRSMTHGINGHETASYIVQTGWKPGDGINHPSVGAVVSLKKGYSAGYKNLLPPYIVVTSPQGRFSEAGFLGSHYKPFATGGDPNKDPFIVEGIISPEISKQRQIGRRQLLNNLDTLAHKLKGNSLIDQLTQMEDSAYQLILGDSAKPFNLSLEDANMRNRYGRNTFGQSCLLARRLVESGVPYITINFNGWDTHKQNFEAMRKQLPDFDKGLSVLLQELSEKGLLDSTIVWVSTEFGRTPKISWEEPWNGGRHHFGQVFSSVVAGGGFKPGQVVGSSDSTGSAVLQRPVYPSDLLGSIYELLGIDISEPLLDSQGQKIPLLPPLTENNGSAGLLKEIM